MQRMIWIWLTVALLGLAGCNTAAPAPDAAATELIVMTHDSFAVSEAVLQQFAAEHGVTVQLLPAGDAGSALNQLILSRDEPLADVFFGVDNTFMGRALAADIFAPYAAEMGLVSAEFDLDPTDRLTPIDYGDVCLNYDIDWLAANSVPPPASLRDLTDPAYRGLLVVQNPATSSPGLAFLLATVAVFGTDGDYTYIDYWRDLRANDVLVTDGWSDAYFGQFSAASDGNRPIVVSYATSPPAEVFYAEGALETPPSAAVVAPDTCFRQVEFAGVVKGTPRPALAQAFIDFMLSVPFQEDIPLNMFVFPVNRDAALPPLFEAFAAVPQQPVTLTPDVIDAGREAWLDGWRDAVLR